ncbi:MAG: hypothetical protein ACXVPD_12375 [Bacteroidia bacterium]
MIDLNYGRGRFYFEKSSNQPDYIFGSTINMSTQNSVQMDLQYKLAKKTFVYQENALYIGVGIAYTNFGLNITEPAAASTGGHFPTTYSYSPASFTTYINTLNYRLFIGHVFTEQKFFFSQKLGLSYFSMISGPATITYTYSESGGYPTQDPSAPGGYSFYNYNYTTKMTEQYKLSAGISPFYNVSFGFNLKRFVPFTGFEMMYFNNRISSPKQYISSAIVSKLQAGLLMKF